MLVCYLVIILLVIALSIKKTQYHFLTPIIMLVIPWKSMWSRIVKKRNILKIFRPTAPGIRNRMNIHLRPTDSLSITSSKVDILAS